VAEAEEPDEANYLRRHAKREEEALRKSGLSAIEATLQSR